LISRATVKIVGSRKDKEFDEKGINRHREYDAIKTETGF
jgi:hypothetical protein